MKLTKLNFRLTVIAKLIIIIVFHSTTTFATNLIPTANTSFYYQIGGGDDVPMPVFYDTSYVPLVVSSDLGLGYDCGAFNPVASVQNSLNEIKGSALDVEKQVLQDATAAVTEFPLYEISRADPNLYNLLTNAIENAREDMVVSTKSCEMMQDEMADGGNPYAKWGQISLGNRWKKEIGDAELSGNGDINQARQNVSKDAGKSGIPWIDPNDSNNTVYAGGENQMPVHVIHDSVMAGYHTIVNDNASYQNANELFAPQASGLKKLFPTASSAATWIIDVVGDETITTYNNGAKQSQPGTGLYTAIELEAKKIQPKLQALVAGAKPVTVNNLKAVSVNGIALSPSIIADLQNQPVITQTILINKLSQNIAAMQVIGKAQAAIQILQTSESVPVIYSNSMAKTAIHAAVNKLQQQTENVITFIKARQALMSNMLSIVAQAGNSEVQQNTAMAAPSSNVPVMQDGAVSGHF